MRQNNRHIILVFLSVLLMALCTAPCLSAQNLDNLSIEELREMANKYWDTDKSKYFSISLEAAKRGDPQSQYKVAMCYKYEWGVAEDFTQAIYWYEKAAESGGCEEYSDLAYCYEKTGNMDKAIKWYLVDISYDSPQAPSSAFALGLFYKERNNRSEAIKWLKKSADIYMEKYNRISTFAIEALAELGVTYTPKKSTGTSVTSSAPTSGSTASPAKKSSSSEHISLIKKNLAAGMWSIPYSELKQSISQNDYRVFLIYNLDKDGNGVRFYCLATDEGIKLTSKDIFKYKIPSMTKIEMTFEDKTTLSLPLKAVDIDHFEIGSEKYEKVSQDWLKLAGLK